MRSGLITAAVVLALAVPFVRAHGPGTGDGDGPVFYARDEALELAFPDADRTEARDFLLTPEERSEIEHRARAPIDSQLLTVYLGYRNHEVIRYAFIDTHVVRTKPEALMIVLTPDGEVDATHLLAFYEPMQYRPGERWLEQFPAKTLEDDLRVDNGVDGITGSTLTARAVSRSVRRALAIHSVLLDGS